MFVIDDIECASLERERARAAEYKTVQHGGFNYPGFSVHEDKAFADKVGEFLGVPVVSHSAMYRRFFRGEIPVGYIHNDINMGDYTAILYLNPPDQCEGGTAFWRNRELGWEGCPVEPEVWEAAQAQDTPAFWHQMWRDGFDESKWEMTKLVEMKFGRLLIYPAALFHSWYPKDVCHATDINESRLIKVLFCKT